MRRWVLVGVCAGITSLNLIDPLCASVTRYTSESAFLAAAPVAHTETFDDRPSWTVLGGPAVVVDGVTYTASPEMDGIDPNLWIIGIQFDIIPHASAPNDFGSALIGEDTLTFGDGGSTPAIGFYLRTPAVFPTPLFQIFVKTMSGQTFEDDLSFVSGTSPYRGFFAPEGITSVMVRNDPAAHAMFNLSYDNVSRGAIPEPLAAGPLALVASAGLLRRAQRR
ncbi:MAG: hypothetical protein QOE14_1367 [Humisphaera sp.]|nr:hypothetical protein [Humisphaera sp.]